MALFTCIVLLIFSIIGNIINYHKKRKKEKIVDNFINETFEGCKVIPNKNISINELKEKCGTNSEEIIKLIKDYTYRLGKFIDKTMNLINLDIDINSTNNVRTKEYFSLWKYVRTLQKSYPDITIAVTNNPKNVNELLIALKDIIEIGNEFSEHAKSYLIGNYSKQYDLISDAEQKEVMKEEIKINQNKSKEKDNSNEKIEYDFEEETAKPKAQDYVAGAILLDTVDKHMHNNKNKVKDNKCKELEDKMNFYGLDESEKREVRKGNYKPEDFDEGFIEDEENFYNDEKDDDE